MDNTLKKKVNKFINHTKLFLDLMKSKSFEKDKDKDINELLKAQHSFTEGILKDLGLIYNDKDETIKNLRNQIHDMESTSNEISLSNIGIFINALEKDLKESFYNEGINCIIRVSISQILEINISCIDMISEEPREYEYNSDIEREELILKNKEIIKRNKSKYDIVKKGSLAKETSEESVLSYTENNKIRMIDLVNSKLVDEQFIDYNIDVKNLFGKFKINSMNIKYNILNSNKNFNDYMKKMRS